jgi:EAL domain-containing protein (putative c-di-GMP-specific phosphodiesterase class I)
MRAKRIVALEALLRWNHPVEGLLGPDEFIHVAEETGAIVDIGAWVIQEACAAGRRLRQIAPEHAGLVMNVNVSGRQLGGDALAQAVAQSLTDTATEPGLLCLELTETTFIAEGSAHAKVLEDLEALGVRLAIDDFGTGQSSLRYLGRLPVQTVKVDRSFVAQMKDGEGGAPILRAAVSMAGALGLEAVAEGVEDSADEAELIQMGYRLAQGYLFARPMPEADAAALLAGRAPAPEEPAAV